jgi:hypothetical protein
MRHFTNILFEIDPDEAIVHCTNDEKNAEKCVYSWGHSQPVVPPTRNHHGLRGRR